MKNTVLGFDVGSSHIKIARRERDTIRVETAAMPENLVRDGVVQMPHMLTDFLKELKKELRLPGGVCGAALPDALTVYRTITMPAMTQKQLELNLPFEFSDYISGEAQEYVYDYAVHEILYDEDGEPKEMTLTGAAANKETVRSYVEIFKNAGLKLRTLIPQEAALTNIMARAVKSGIAQAEKEYCIVNLGHNTTQVYIFKNALLQVVRNLPIGGAAVDAAIAEHENVDGYIARTYKNSNYNAVLDKEYSREVFGRIAVETMKVINFYRYNNRESTLEDMYFAGGASAIPALRNSVSETAGLRPRLITELMDGQIIGGGVGFLAIGVLMQ